MFDLLASAILVSIVLQPQNVYQGTSYFCNAGVAFLIDIPASALLPGFPYAVVALVCFLLIVSVWEAQDREYHDMEGSVAQKQQPALSHGSDPACSSSNDTISGLEINSKFVSAISPKLDPAAGHDSSDGTVIPPPTFEGDTKTQKPSVHHNFAGADNVIPTVPVIACLNDTPSVPPSGLNPTPSTKLLVSPHSADIGNTDQPVRNRRNAVSVRSSLSIAKLAITPSVILTRQRTVKNPAVDLSSTQVDVLYSSTPSSGIALATKSLGPVLPMLTHYSQAVPRLTTGLKVSSPGIICGSLTSKTSMLTAPVESPQNRIPNARRQSVSVFSCPKESATDLVNSPVTTVSTVLDINISPAGTPLVCSEICLEREPIIPKNDVEATVQSRFTTECASVSTSSFHLAPPGEPIAQSTPSCVKQVSQASPDFNHKLAPDPVSSHSSDAPPQPNPSAMPTARPRFPSKQDSTTPASFPARSKRIRITSTRSPFDRALQAIRDASTTIGDRTKDRGALSTATGKKNVADSTSLKNEGVQTRNSTKSAIPHIPKRAHPAGPRPLVNYPPTIVSQTVTQTQAITIPPIRESKTSNPTSMSCRVPSVPSNVKNDDENVRSRPPAVFDNSVSTMRSIVVSQTVTQTQAITIPSIRDSKTNNPTSMSCRVPSVPSNVKNDDENVRSRPPAVFDNSVSTMRSIVMPINRERVTSATSRSLTMDAEPTVKFGAHSGKARTVVQRIMPILSVVSHDVPSKMPPLPPPRDVLSIDLQSAPKVIDPCFPGSSAVVDNGGPAVTPSSLKNSPKPTILKLEASMTGTLAYISCYYPIVLTTISVVPAPGSEVNQTLEHFPSVVDPSVVDSTCPMLVDEPILSRSTCTVQKDTLPMMCPRNEEAPSLSLSSNHSTLQPLSPRSMSVASSAATPSRFVIEHHHLPTISSFTFGINKGMPTATGHGTDREGLPFLSLMHSPERVQDPHWKFASPSSTWNVIDGAPITPECNPWHDVRSMAPTQLHGMIPPSPMSGQRPVELQSMSSIDSKLKESQWPYSMFIPLSLAPLASDSPRDDPVSTAPVIPSASIESYTESSSAGDPETMMVVDDPAPVECPGHIPTSSTRAASSASEALPIGTGTNPSVIPWKAPSLQKRLHLETMDNDAQSSQSYLNRNEPQSNQPFEEQRESKRLRRATCNVYDTLPVWGKVRSKESGRLAVKKRVSKADLAEDWRLRRKPVLLTARGVHAEFATVDVSPFT